MGRRTPRSTPIKSSAASDVYKRQTYLRGAAVDENESLERPYEEKGYEIHDDLYDRRGRLEETVQKIIKLRFFEELTLD